MGQHWACDEKRAGLQTRHHGSSLLAFPCSEANSKESKNSKLEDSFIGYYEGLFVKLGGKGISLMVSCYNLHFWTDGTWVSIFMLVPVKD